jgi:hypothetical protein
MGQNLAVGAGDKHIGHPLQLVELIQETLEHLYRVFGEKAGADPANATGDRAAATTIFTRQIPTETVGGGPGTTCLPPTQIGGFAPAGSSEI